MASGNRPRALALALAALLPAVHADESAEREHLRALRDQAAAIEAAAQQALRPSWLTDTPSGPAAQAGVTLGRTEATRWARAAETAQAEACAALDTDCASAPPDVAPPPERLVTILVSRGLGDAALRAVFTAAAASTSTDAAVRIVFRGIGKGESMMDFVRAVHALLAGLDPPPTVEIDPRPFQEAGAQAVPLMLCSTPDGEVARVAGLTDPAWLLEQVRAGRTGDLGQRGPLAPITEPDLLAEIERRIRALDVDALKERAQASYWKRARFEHLPPATEPRERRIDPTVEARADIVLPDGRVLAHAGERLNPLDRLPFTLRLVVFDASDPAQVALARTLGEAPGARALYLATRFERERGWDGYTSVEDTLDEPVYLLTPDVRERFALERVPATVEAEDRAFVVREFVSGRP